VRIGPLIIERKTDEELTAELREGAAAVRRGGLGRLGEREAKAAEAKAARLERRS